MIDKRLFLAFGPLALLAACNDAAEDGGSAANGDVAQGTISDEMLPIDRVRSEAPLEDPEAFAQAREEAAEGAADATPAPAEDAQPESPEDPDEALPAEAEPAAED